MRREIKSAQRQMRIIAVSKAGLGTPTLSGPDSSQVAVVDNGVGDYNINPVEPFGNTPIVIVQSKTTGVLPRIPGPVSPL